MAKFIFIRNVDFVKNVLLRVGVIKSEYFTLNYSEAFSLISFQIIGEGGLKALNCSYYQCSDLWELYWL